MVHSDAGTEQSGKISLFSLSLIFLRLGALTFGGMWAAADRIEKDLVHRRNLITSDELRAMMITAALIPAPKFLGFGGMVGYRVRGYFGSCVALTSLMAPGATLITIAAIFLRGSGDGTLLATIQTSVGLGIVGLLLGNATKMAMKSKLPRRDYVIGLMLGASVPIAVLIFDISLLIMAVGGLIVGSFLIRPRKDTEKADTDNNNNSPEEK